MKGQIDLVRLICFLLVFLVGYFQRTLGALIKVNVFPAWGSTSIYHEMCEYWSGYHETVYWQWIDKLIDAVENGKLDSTNLNEPSYHTLMQKCKELEESLKHVKEEQACIFLESFTGLRQFSPRVNYWYERDQQDLADCSSKNVDSLPVRVWVYLNNECIFDVDILRERLSSLSTIMQYGIPPTVEEFDHIYPYVDMGHFSPPPAIVYADIVDPFFFPFHYILKQFASNSSVKYVLRYRKPASYQSLSYFYLSDYGVELLSKNMEYKPVDNAKLFRTFNNEQLKPSLSNNISKDGVEGIMIQEAAKYVTDMDSKEVSPNNLQRAITISNDLRHEKLTIEEWACVGINAIGAIMDGHDKLERLNQISQNLPIFTAFFGKRSLNSSAEIIAKSNSRILAGFHQNNLIYINGRLLDIKDIGFDRLLERLLEERRLWSFFLNLGMNISDIETLLLNYGEKEDSVFKINLKSKVIVYLNNLETDRRYAFFPSSVLELSRTYVPGQMSGIRKNIFDILLIIDPSTSQGLDLINYATFRIRQTYPWRFGVIFTNIDDSLTTELIADKVSALFLYLRKVKGVRVAVDFLHGLRLSLWFVKKDLSKLQLSFTKASHSRTEDLKGDSFEEITHPDSIYMREVNTMNIFLAQKNLAKRTGFFLNGIELEINEHLESTLFYWTDYFLGLIRKGVLDGEINDSSEFPDYWYSLSDVYSRASPFVTMLTKETINSDHRRQFLLTNLDTLSLKLNEINYFHSNSMNESSEPPITFWIFSDWSTEKGRNYFCQAFYILHYSENVRIAFIDTSSSWNFDASTQFLAKIAYGSFSMSDEFMKTFVSSFNDFCRIAPMFLQKKDWETNQTNLSLEASSLWLKIIDLTRSFLNSFDSLVNIWKRHKTIQQFLPFRAESTSVLVANGRIIEIKNLTFDFEDFKILASYERRQRLDTVWRTFKNMTIDRKADLFWLVQAKLGIVLQPRSFLSLSSFLPEQFRFQSFCKHCHLPLVVDFVIDPLSKVGQKLAAFLLPLKGIDGLDLRVYLTTSKEVEKSSIDRFYRYVLQNKLQFDKSQVLSQGPSAIFSTLSTDATFTLNLETFQSWLVFANRSSYDLDNLKTDELAIDEFIPVEFRLESILIEGHCQDATAGPKMPLRGTEFILGSKISSHVSDTIVMENLAYFQLRANPGLWNLRLREGASREVFNLIVTTEDQTKFYQDYISLHLRDYRGVVIFPKLARKQGMETVDLLNFKPSNTNLFQDSFWSSWGRDLLGLLKGGTSRVDHSKTLNIFSLASGHMYERLLRIMFLSVKQHTSYPVKFWLIANFLSPTFKESLPFIAEKYDFQYELVTYKWPQWLRSQTEKQRIIWGYKILFLDVLFPLDVEKIVYVDADQIVRADLKELIDMDLQGAPYGYTPFCESREGMDSFRFWRTGYWAQHLQKKPYHISALYVVDLKRFRQIAAGDRLRGQYEMLSSDPNSLANLDQDLPNNLQHVIPIYSLPQEWLWCETWCDLSSLQRAKTIDLCNNPLTKEPKLKVAARLLPEWTEYDNELHKAMLEYEETKSNINMK